MTHESLDFSFLFRTKLSTFFFILRNLWSIERRGIFHQKTKFLTETFSVCFAQQQMEREKFWHFWKEGRKECDLKICTRKDTLRFSFLHHDLAYSFIKIWHVKASQGFWIFHSNDESLNFELVIFNSWVGRAGRRSQKERTCSTRKTENQQQSLKISEKKNISMSIWGRRWISKAVRKERKSRIVNRHSIYPLWTRANISLTKFMYFVCKLACLLKK